MKFKPNFMAGLWDCYESATFGTKLKIRFGQNQSFSRTVFFSRFSQFNRWKPRNLVGLVMWGIFHWSAVCTFLNSILYKIVFTTKIQLNRNVCVFHTPSKEIALKYIYIHADFIINLHISQYTIEPYLFCYYYSCVVICFYGIFERIIRLFFYIHISTRTKTFGNYIRFIIKISYCIEVDFFSFIQLVI